MSRTALGSNMRIRPAVPDDADALTTLCMISKRSNGYDDAFMEACRDELRVTPDRLRDAQFWVAEADAIHGCAALQVDDDVKTGEVGAFFVHPDSQRKGVGSMLWRTISQAATDQRLKLLHLDADPLAVSFYESVGFVVVGQTPSGSIPGRAIPYMELAVDRLRAD